MKVILVKRKGLPYSVGCGKYCFFIENDELVKDECLVWIKHIQKDYEEAFELATFAFQNNIFDSTESHW